MGRFINADAFASTGQGILGANMFVYCGNEPVCFADEFGRIADLCITFDGGGKWEEPTKVIYDVPLYYQGQTNLCWAYCMLMRQSYLRGEVLDEKNAFAEAKALGERFHPILDWNTGLPFFMQGLKTTIPTIESLFYILQSEGPVYAAYLIPGTHDGHIVLVTGVDLETGLVYTNNPWKKRGKQTFSEFLIHFVGDNMEQVQRYYFYAIYIPID